jgi:UDP-glucose 4-epimerase
MSKILIIGANGYIGSRLCLYLLGKNYNVTALCHSNKFDLGPDSHNFKIIIGDVRDEQLVQKLADDGFDIVINLVSLDHHQSNGDPAFVLSVNVTPTYTLLDAFSKRGLKHYIYLSTTQVYGKLTKGKIEETYPAKPVNAYGLTHALCENICEYYNKNSDIACTVLRISNSYGSPLISNNNCWSLVINELCKSAIENQEIKLLSDGTPLRDFIHGNDVCNAIELLISTDNQELKKDIYNVCSGATYSIMELAQKVKSVYDRRFNKNISIQIPSGEIIKDDAYYVNQTRYSISNDKLNAIGFKSTVDLDEGINDLFDHLVNR